jgi:hypothetical protein
MLVTPNLKLIAKLCLVWFVLFIVVVLTTQLSSHAQSGFFTLNIADTQTSDLDDQDGSSKVLKDFNFLVADQLEFKPRLKVESSFSYEFAYAEFETVNPKLPRGPPSQSLA